MIEALISFLGGTAFRMIWGEVSAWLTARQEHQREVERMRLQGDLDAAAHERNLAAQRLQADLGIKVIEAQSVAREGEIEAGAWLTAVQATAQRVGIAWVDAWNAVIRPGVATWAVLMLTAREFGWIPLTATTEAVAFAALGLFLADRTLGKRGK
jgi:hypothetical protein